MCMAGLARSREVGDLWNLRRLLTQMAILDLQAGRTEDAAAHLREMLQLALQTSGQSHLLDGLYFCGYLCDQTGRYADAVTVWAAERALSAEGYRDPPMYIQRQQEALYKARQVLGPVRAREAEDRGAAMSLATAAEYALMLTAPFSQQAPSAGLANLSAREQELVTLVARGRTNAQIAAELYISVRTVGSHLDRIRDKTGCRRRADLTRLALSTGLV
jgi:DNA-binding CsgD family transcriptional regulator